MTTDDIVQLIHLLVLAATYGMLFYSTYIVGPKLVLNLKRPEFGKVQSILFPVYFLLGTILSLVLFFSFAYLHRSDLFICMSKSNIQQLVLVHVNIWWNQLLLKNPIVWTAVLYLYMSICSFFEMVVVGPLTTRIMIKRDQAKDRSDKMEQWKALQRSFSIWHGVNSLMDLSVFISATVILVLLSFRIKI